MDDAKFDQIMAMLRKCCHDMNQPLTVMIARTELLMLKMERNDPNFRDIQQIHEQSMSLSDHVDNLRQIIRDNLKLD